MGKLKSVAIAVSLVAATAAGYKAVSTIRDLASNIEQKKKTIEKNNQFIARLEGLGVKQERWFAKMQQFGGDLQTIDKIQDVVKRRELLKDMLYRIAMLRKDYYEISTEYNKILEERLKDSESEEIKTELEKFRKSDKVMKQKLDFLKKQILFDIQELERLD